ncbi:hypothetical protein P2H44_18460 [Albimonas sp. CAU 1670]|uniref:hypothetical protein n=1 Tax=Albimonas sp. CAU 1670 TaxID=3032599 RepID=UPI0023DBA718|nr:hypothetical protein [Albimonas sp. CAU 1670]MDF2234548.1 hypothetical protein [Albimonas sp. CAU 1670]
MHNNKNLIEWQRDQYQHDLRYHFDVISLHKNDRLKHYALHFAKYVGRIARGDCEEKTIEQTVTDAILITLSAANCLHQELAHTPSAERAPLLSTLADASGRFCDCAEKIDHQEPFLDAARRANQDIFNLLIDWTNSADVNISTLLDQRRQQLKQRQFFVR